VSLEDVRRFAGHAVLRDFRRFPPSHVRLGALGDRLEISGDWEKKQKLQMEKQIETS
jgi:hypothetical protein